MQTIAHSESRLLCPDRNPVLRALIKPTIYDQFCAGRNGFEVRSGAAAVKGLGVSGVILAYAKEIELTEDMAKLAEEAGMTNAEAEIQQWLDGCIETLRMTNPEDLMAIKITGAGSNVMQAMVNGTELPKAFYTAVDAMCEMACAQGTRILVDSEQAAVQKSIDRIAIDMMRKWNKAGERPLIYNTIQAYLKESKTKLAEQLSLASKEGWSMGIKLVRGAYIGSEERSLIHDTKADTDASYNGIVRMLLKGEVEGVDNLPRYEMIQAGHNAESIEQSIALATKLAEAGKLKVSPEYGQLQGMADDLGCEVCYESQRLREKGSAFVPRLHKYLVWGSVKECMQYLVRRAIENQSAAEKMKEGYRKYGKELRRRMGRSIGLAR